MIQPTHISEFPAVETTIAEVLKKSGYATAHLGKWHLGGGGPGQHGFDVHDGDTGNETPEDVEGPKDITGLTERAKKFMEAQAKAGKTFYLQLSHYAVHTPIESQKASQEKFSGMQKGERHSDAEFAAMTWDLDASIGELLDKINELKLTDNTYVVLMSDNGGVGNPRQSQNLPLNGGKGTLYEGGIRVPLIIRGPDIKADSLCREGVTGCDLFPTFCEWAEISEIEKLAGVSLLPLLSGKGKFQRCEDSLLFHYPHYGLGPAQKPQSALILGKYKLLKELETETLHLFDLEKDISEKNDLADKLPEKTAELDALMTRRLKELDAQMPSKNPDYDPDAKQERPRGARR